MADVQYVKENRLAQEASSTRKTVLLVGAPIVLVLCLMFSTIWWWFLLFYAIVVLNAGTIKRSGAKGEDQALKKLKDLPDTYTVFNQLEVPHDKSRRGFIELDFVVVGPNGVFVVEVKNNNSRIVGNVDEREWTIHKVGRGGTPYTSSMRNPVKQVKSQVWALSEYLKKKGHRVWIEGCLFFSHDNCSVEMKGQSTVPVLQQIGLASHINNYQPKRWPKEQEKVVESLRALLSPS